MSDEKRTEGSGGIPAGGPWAEIKGLLSRYDGDAKFECSSLTAWSGEIRLTLTDEPGVPSRSIAFYYSGAADPEQAARMVLDEVIEWLGEPDSAPMPVQRADWW